MHLSKSMFNLFYSWIEKKETHELLENQTLATVLTLPNSTVLVFIV